MNRTELRFGVWAAVHGNRGAHHDPEEPYDASWKRNRALVLDAEALGYDSVLIAQHAMNPHDDRLDQLEAWTAAAALAALTSRIEIIAAIKPALYHPAVLAKMAMGVEAVSRGRFALNLVSAWNRAEVERAGMAFPAHDDRYASGREWIAVVKGLMSGERVDFKGEHSAFDDDALRPPGAHRARPLLYVGGESEPARAPVADHGDVRFIKGNPEQAAAFLAPIWGNIAPDVVEAVNARRSYAVLPVAKSDLGDQQRIADTFHDAKLIPRALDATAVPLWAPGSRG